MSQSKSLRKTRRHGLLLAVIAVVTSLIAGGATAAVATASTKAPTPAAAATSHHTTTTKPKPKHKAKHKAKHKKKHKPKPKPTTTTTAPPTTQTTTEKPPSGNVTISEDGSSLLYPLFQLWAQAYNQEFSNVNVTPAAGGSGKGINDASAGVVNIGGSDAYLSSTQLQVTPGLMNIALAISAQAIVTNINDLSGSQHLDLSGQVISQIYQGKISYWDDSAIQKLNPNANLPHQQIVALHRSDSSGDTFIFSAYMAAADPSGWGSSIGYGTTVSFPSISNSLGENGNGGMVTGCNTTPGCIAYIGVSYNSQIQQDGLQTSAISNASGNYELPTASTITAEAHALESQTPPSETLSMIYDNAPGGYPIVNYEYAIVQKHQSSSTTAAAMRAFMDWTIDPANGSNNSFLRQVNFIPLTPAVQALSVAQIAEIGS